MSFNYLFIIILKKMLVKILGTKELNFNFESLFIFQK